MERFACGFKGTRRLQYILGFSDQFKNVCAYFIIWVSHPPSGCPRHPYWCKTYTQPELLHLGFLTISHLCLLSPSTPQRSSAAHIQGRESTCSPADLHGEASIGFGLFCAPCASWAFRRSACSPGITLALGTREPCLPLHWRRGCMCDPCLPHPAQEGAGAASGSLLCLGEIFFLSWISGCVVPLRHHVSVPSPWRCVSHLPHTMHFCSWCVSWSLWVTA